MLIRLIAGDVPVRAREPVDATDEEIISVLSEASDPVLSTKELSEKLPIKQNAAQKRLKNLYEEVEGKKAGRSWIWWISDSRS